MAVYAVLGCMIHQLWASSAGRGSEARSAHAMGVENPFHGVPWHMPTLHCIDIVADPDSSENGFLKPNSSERVKTPGVVG